MYQGNLRALLGRYGTLTVTQLNTVKHRNPDGSGKYQSDGCNAEDEFYERTGVLRGYDIPEIWELETLKTMVNASGGRRVALISACEEEIRISLLN